jgi:hypothetical protein
MRFGDAVVMVAYSLYCAYSTSEIALCLRFVERV